MHDYKVKTGINIVGFEMSSYILLFISLYTIGTISSFTVSWTYTIVLFFLAAVFMLLKVIINGKVRINDYIGLWFVVIFICFLCSIHSGEYRDLVFYIISGVMVIGSSLSSKENQYRCLYIMLLGSIIFSMGILIQYFFPTIYDNYIFPLFPSFYRADIKRQYYRHKMYTGFNSEASISAQFMMLGFISIYSFLFNIKSNIKKIILIIISIILFVCIVLTGKRSSLLFMLLALLYTIIIAAPKKKRIIRFFRVMLILLVLAIVAYLFLPNIVSVSSSRNAIVRFFESFDSSDITNGRLSIWKNAMQAFLERPVFGQGWGWFKQQHGMGAHNIYIQLLCECGVIGALIIISILIILFIQCHNKLSIAIENKDQISISLMKFCMYSQTYILLYGLTGNPLYNYSFFIWYVFTLCLLASNIPNKAKMF